MTRTDRTPLSDKLVRQWLAGLDLFQVACQACRQGFVRRRTLQSTDAHGESNYQPASVWDGQGSGASAQRSASHWHSAGAYTLFHGLDPDVCLDVRFRMAGSEPLAPRQVFCEAYLEAYQNACQEKLALLPLELETDQTLYQLRILEAQQHYGMTAEAACEFTVGDIFLPYTNLFRFCIAWRQGIGYLAQAYATGAAEQYYVAMPAYDNIWGDLLPGVFRRVVASAYEDALGKSRGSLDREAGQSSPTRNQPLSRRQEEVGRDPRQAKEPPEPLRDYLAGEAIELHSDPISQPTGVGFLDRLLPDGQAAGEVYIILGPICGGKTTLAVVLGCTVARRLHAIQLGSDKPSPIVYMAFWEEPLNSMRARMLSFTAEIPKDTLENFTLDALSTSEDPASYKEYERKRYASLLEHGRKPPGERERLQMALDAIRSHIVAIDFTGSERALAKRGTRLVTGLAAAIKKDQAEKGNPGVAMVIADHAHAAAVVHCSAKGLDPTRHLRRLIATIPSELKTEVASRYQCPVWILHQLNCEANTRSVDMVPKATDAMEASNFADHCDACIVLGKKDFSNVLVMANVKCRQASNPLHQYMRLDGLFATFREVNGRYASGGSHTEPPQEQPRDTARRKPAPGKPAVSGADDDVQFDF